MYPFLMLGLYRLRGPVIPQETQRQATQHACLPRAMGTNKVKKCQQSLPGSQTGGSPAPTLPWGQWASLRYTSFAGGGAVVDSKNIVCHVNSSACHVYVTYTTSISFYKSFYTFRVFIYFLQLHFRGHFRVHFRTSTPTFICGRTATSLFYTHTHLWMNIGL
jgi:hypothetical protein